MLDVYSSIVEKLDLNFNVKKSMVLRIGQRYKSKCTDLYLSGQSLSYVAVIKYLGISIESGLKFRCSCANVVMKFYRSFNSLYSKCKSASSEVICINLLKSYCLPIIYGIEAVNPVNRDICKLDKLVSQAVSKIFCTFDADIIIASRKSFGLYDLHHLICKRIANLIQNYSSKSFYF